MKRSASDYVFRRRVWRAIVALYLVATALAVSIAYVTYFMPVAVRGI